MTNTIEGSDDAFMMMLFAFVATICSLLLVEFFFFFKAYTNDFSATVAWLGQCFHIVSAEPQKIRTGIQALQNNREYTKKFVVPLGWRVLRRWRWMMWVMCMVLFSIVAYQKLSFDPYHILGVSPKATDGEIRKAYRKMSRMYHPDKNKTEEARIIYANVKKAYKYLENPDDTDVFNDGTQNKVGSGIPSFLTNKDNAAYSLVGLMLVLFAAPFYLVLWLTQKDNSRNVVPMMQGIASNIFMAEPFFDLLGQPHSADRDAVNAERGSVLELIRNVQNAGGFDRSEEFPVAALDVVTHFRPDVPTYAEMWHLINDVTSPDSKSTVVKESDTRLRDCNIVVQRENSADIQRVLQKMRCPTAEELEQGKALRERRAKGQVPAEYQFTMPSDDDVSVAMYFLAPLLDKILEEVSMVYPRTNNARDIAYRLSQAYRNRLDHLQLLRRHATDKGVTSFDASNKLQTDILSKAVTLQYQSERFAFELVNEMRSLTKQRLRASAPERSRGKKKA